VGKGSGNGVGIGSAGNGSGVGGEGHGRGNGAGPGGNGNGLHAGRSGAAVSGGAGQPELLRAIRRQIQQTHAYPDAARREGLQGTALVAFRIASDGAVERLEIERSSGSRILDDASLRTIRRAAPYPPYPDWIRIPLTYKQDDPQ
jgi:periplasmic protein TonB